LDALAVNANEQRQNEEKADELGALLVESQKVRGTAMLLHPNFIKWTFEPTSSFAVVQGQDSTYTRQAYSCLSFYLQLAHTRFVEDGNATCVYFCGRSYNSRHNTATNGLVSSLIRSVCWQLLYHNDHILELPHNRDDLREGVQDGDIGALFQLLYIILDQMVTATNIVIIIDGAHWLESENNFELFKSLVDRFTIEIARFRQGHPHHLKVLFAYPQRSQIAATWGSDHLTIDVTDDYIALARAVSLPETADDLQKVWRELTNGEHAEEGELSLQ
jgi:hypothetical protein